MYNINKQTNKQNIFTVMEDGTWPFLLGNQSKNDCIGIPNTVALIINWNKYIVGILLWNKQINPKI